MSVRNASPAALSARSPTAQAGDLGREAGLVDEDKALRIEIGLPVAQQMEMRQRMDDIGDGLAPIAAETQRR